MCGKRWNLQLGNENMILTDVSEDSNLQLCWKNATTFQNVSSQGWRQHPIICSCFRIRIYLEKIKNLRLYKWGVQQRVFTQFAFVNTFCAWSDNASCREKHNTYPYRLLLRTSQRKQSRYQQWEGVDSLCSNDTWKLQYLLDFCWCRSSVN